MTIAQDAYSLAETAAAALTELTGQHDVALVLGSGWSEAADALGAAEHEFPVDQLPGFAPATVIGHAGKIRSVRVGGNLRDGPLVHTDAEGAVVDQADGRDCARDANCFIQETKGAKILRFGEPMGHDGGFKGDDRSVPA